MSGYLGYNNVREFKGIETLKTLKYLFLEHCDLDNIPADLYRAKYLEKLRLSYNRISSISSKISGLAQLKVLEVSNNRLSHLPK